MFMIKDGKKSPDNEQGGPAICPFRCSVQLDIKTIRNILEQFIAMKLNQFPSDVREHVILSIELEYSQELPITCTILC